MRIPKSAFADVLAYVFPAHKFCGVLVEVRTLEFRAAKPGKVAKSVRALESLTEIQGRVFLAGRSDEVALIGRIGVWLVLEEA